MRRRHHIPLTTESDARDAMRQWWRERSPRVLIGPEHRPREPWTLDAMVGVAGGLTLIGAFATVVVAVIY